MGTPSTAALLATLLYVTVYGVTAGSDVGSAGVQYKATWTDCPVISPTTSLFRLSVQGETAETATSVLPVPSRMPGFNLPTAMVAGSEDALAAQCGYMEVPLDWSKPLTKDNTFRSFAKRVYAKGSSKPSPRQVFLLNGGPGGAGEHLETLAVRMMGEFGGDVDIFIPDHRGTGRSSRMEDLCSDEMSSYECYDKLLKSGSNFYTTSASSRDVIAFMEDVRSWVVTGNHQTGGLRASKDPESTAELFLYGVSYGTYWSNRLLEIIMAEKGGKNALAYPDRVTLDGICPPTTCRFASYSLNLNKVGTEDFLRGRCNKDKFCSKMFEGRDPVRVLDEAISRLESGDAGEVCKDLVNKGLNREAITTFLGLTITSQDTRLLGPALIKRLERCNDNDVKVFKSIAKYLAAASQAPQDKWGSMYLQFNVGLSEMFFDSTRTVPPTMTDLTGIEKDALYMTVTSSLREVYDDFPLYSVDSDPYYFKFGMSSYQGPTLLLNGDLDPQTPVEWAHLSRRFLNSNPDTLYVEVPNAPHATIMQSRTTDGDVSTPPCGMSMVTSFFKFGKPDVSCIDRLAPIDFECAGMPCREQARAIMGTEDIWG